MYTLNNVKTSMPKEKAREDSIWAKMWVRSIGNLLAWLCIRIGISANQVSVVAIIDVWLACILMCTNSIPFIILGIVLLNLFIVFDATDGTIARTLKKDSYMGEFFDALGGYTICAFSLLAVGICAANTGKVMLINNPIFLVACGALGSISDILSRLTYQKYTANTMIANYKMGKPIYRENDVFYTDNKKLSFTYLRLKIDREFGVGGFFSLLVLVCYFTDTLDLLCILYTIYHLLAYLVVTVVFCKKASNFGKQLNS